MAARTSASHDNGWVDARRGLVSRDVFVSNDIFRLEMERIFDRTWVFLAHETEVPAAGDFVSRNLGSAPVVVVRDSGGTVHVLLNSCRHRGPRFVVRIRAALATSFVRITAGPMIFLAG